MDVASLAAEIAAALAPALPFLLETGGKAVEAAAGKIGEDSWEKAKGVWGRLRGKVAEDPAAAGAARKLADKPEDERRRNALALQLEELLEVDGDLAHELAKLLGPGARLQTAVVRGGGTAIQSQGSGTTAAAGDHGFAVARDLTFIHTQHVYVQQIVGSLAGAASPPDLERGMKQYQENLLSRHRHLEFRGMGVNDRIPLLLPLLDLYIPGRAQARLPEGDAAERESARELRLAGRRASAEEIEAMGVSTRPADVLDLLRERDGLVLLGDPGAGKSTLLKFLALKLARGEGEELRLGLRLPVLAPLAAYAGKLAGDRSLSLPAFLAGLLGEQGVPAAAALLEEGLRTGRMLFLLDGLDEVAAEAVRHLVVARVKDFYCEARREGNKFVLTSRIVGYREVRLEAPAAWGRSRRSTRRASARTCCGRSAAIPACAGWRRTLSCSPSWRW